MQNLHPDFRTDIPNTQYFFLGSGKIQVAIQWSKDPSATPLGIIFSRGSQFTRKLGSHLFHTEYGLERTMITTIIDGVRYTPTHDNLSVTWSEHEGVPNVFAKWMAGEHEVIESFWTSPGTDTLVRWIWIKNCKDKTVEVEASLYASPNRFSTFGTGDSLLYASGYSMLYLGALEEAVVHERTMTIAAAPFFGDSKEVHLTYSDSGAPMLDIDSLFSSESFYWKQTSCIIPDTNKQIAQTFNATKNGLRAAIGSNGRFDASIWQYGMEWGRDAAKVAEGLVYTGQFEFAKKVLTNIITKLSNEEGMIAEASRFRGGKQSELDSNGFVLSAIKLYVDWTGDDEFLGLHWNQIAAIAEYPLRPEFLDVETGMFKATREIWERNAAMGILEGYGVAHQTSLIKGLSDAAELAAHVNEKEQSSKWKAASDKAAKSFTLHPSHSMIENNRIIKRRTLDGSHQLTLNLDKSKALKEFFTTFAPSSMPLAKKGEHRLEPDVSQLFPMLTGLIDPTSDIAKNTLNDIATLWSQAWDGGGLGRYDISGEPDSPGPWSVATILFAEAALACGDEALALKALDWLHIKAGAAGTFLEFYGDRPTPPLPPVGILVWAWAEYAILVVRDILGAHIKDGKVSFNPKLGLAGHIRFRDQVVDVS
jgi:hypothetical protein